LQYVCAKRTFETYKRTKISVMWRYIPDTQYSVFEKICVKAHRKANLILRCFESRNISSLTAAF